MSDARGDLALFALTSGQATLERVCARIGVQAARHEERDFEDGEHKIRPLESVRGRDVFVVSSLHGAGGRSVDDVIVRTLFFLAALRDAGARRSTLVAPYLAYARKDRRTKARDPVTSRYLAVLLEAVGLDRMVAIDVHNPAAFQNAFRIPTEHLVAAPALIDRIAPRVGDRGAVVVSPDAGGAKRAERFRQLLASRLGREIGSAFIEKHRSEGVVRGGAVVGQVRGRVAIVVDDLVSSGRTLALAAAACRERGAERVFAAVTHGVFSSEAEAVLVGSSLDRVVVTDTIPLHVSSRLGAELEVVDCAPLIAAAITRLHAEASVVDLTG